MGTWGNCRLQLSTETVYMLALLVLMKFVNSGKMAIKAMEREKVLGAADYIVQDITRRWFVVLV